MKQKNLLMFGIVIFTAVFLMSAVSAATFTTFTETFDNSTATMSYGDNSFLGDNGVTWTFVNSKDAETYNISGESLQFKNSTSKIISDSIPGGISSFSVKLKKATTTPGDREVELFINDVSKGTSTAFDDTGTHTHTFTVDNINVEDDFTIEIRNIQDKKIVIDNIIWEDYSFIGPEEIQTCSTTGNPGQLDIAGIDFTNNGLQYGEFGDDEEWFAFEEIEVEIEIENEGDYDIEDIEVEWGIYDLENEEWLIDLDEETDFDLDEGDEEVFTVSFVLDDDLEIDIDEFSDDSDNYRFYVIATGEIDDKNSPNDGDVTCVFDYEPASIIIEDDFVILNNIEAPETASCGETVQITADVWNIGDDDQEEVSVAITSLQNELVNKVIEIGDIDAFEKQELSFSFEVPSDFEEGRSVLMFEVRDDDNDVYENDYDEEESKFRVPLEISGGCGISEEDITITAILESEAKAGQDIIISSTIINTKDESVTYTISAIGYSEWAEQVQINTPTILLGEGQSQDVTFTFQAKDNSEGTQTFEIEAVSDSGVIRQPVTIDIESGSFFGQITGSVVEGDNAYLWGLGILNIILVIIIIIVAVRIARK